MNIEFEVNIWDYNERKKLIVYIEKLNIELPYYIVLLFNMLLPYYKTNNMDEIKEIMNNDISV